MATVKKSEKESIPDQPELLETLLKRYDVEKIADVIANVFCDELDQAVLRKISEKLQAKAPPQIITVPVIAGNILAGVSYENS